MQPAAKHRRMAGQRPRVVWRPQRAPAPAAAGLALGKLLGPAGDGAWRVEVGGREVTAAVDPAVDPALLEEVQAQGARVVLDTAAAPVVVGALTVARPVSVDREGDVKVAAREFAVTAREQVLLRSPGAFLQVRQAELELFGTRIVTRARELAKILAAMIKLN